MNRLIDTHAHLYDARFDSDRDAVVARAVEAGVETMVAVGICRASSLQSVALAHRYPAVWATVGIHPNDAHLSTLADWDEIVRLSADPRVVGIGETGLDRHWHRCPFAIQEEWFARHLELGRQRNLALVIHAREADADILRMLREAFHRHGPIRAVLHSFTGLASTVTEAVAMGLHVSIAGMVTYPNAQDVRDMAATIPLDRLLVETDCPYLAPQPQRGRRCEPAQVVHTAATLAEVHGIALAELADRTTRNARHLFGLPA
jgi:TatD DNase family protein